MEASFQAAWQQALLHPGVCAMKMPKKQFLESCKSTKRPQHAAFILFQGQHPGKVEKTRIQKHCQTRMCTQIWAHLAS